MDYTRFDDETLMRLIANAKTEALSELYNRYSRLVYGLALHTTRNAETAEEITQDTFLRTWEQAASYRSELGKVSTWIASIARYRSIDMLRRSRARNEHHLLSLDETPLFEISGEHDIEHDFDLLQQQQRIRKALAQLPPDQRDALALAYFWGMTQEQISQTLGEPLGTIKTRIRLAMQKLRQILQEEVTA